MHARLITEHHDELSKLLSQDTGKIFEDAKGDVWRGIEVVEQACNIVSLMMGETVGNVAQNVDTSSLYSPWVCAQGLHLLTFPR